MNKSSWLLLFIAAFAVGIAFRSFYDFGVEFSLFLVFLGVILLLLAVIFKNSPRQRYDALLLAALFFVAAGCGMFRFDVGDYARGDGALREQTGEYVTLQGIIIDEPDIRETHTKLLFKVKSREKILLVAEHYPALQYGDEIIVRGTLEEPTNFSKGEDEPGRPFDYVSYLEKDGIYYQMFYSRIELVAHDKGNPIKGFLFSLKQKMIQNTARLLPEPHNSLLAGINFGVKQSLGDDLLGAFRAAGIIHIVVLSGYNITIVAENVARAFQLVGPRFFGIGASGLTIIAFALMTGAGATVVRACIMALIILLARATGRAYEITVALFVAGFGMLLWNPKTLMFDPSFQLSFLATLGLIQLAPRIEKFFGWMPTRLGLREAATATIATQLFVLPLLIYMMGQVSLVAPLTNILVLPTIPYTMLFGFLTAVLGFVGDAVAWPFAFLTYALLEYQLFIVQLFAGLPFASVSQ
ncbi:MAG: ComEC family competence protein [Parcubacteria group bacterium]|nr:ComEC family competence protein [Parcubacteria group bacterium]